MKKSISGMNPRDYKPKMVIDGEFQLWWKTGTHTCCDCGLVHDYKFREVKDKRVLNVMMARNDKLTKHNRKK